MSRADWIMAIGLTLLIAGVGRIYLPAAPIVLGLLLMLFSFQTAK